MCNLENSFWISLGQAIVRRETGIDYMEMWRVNLLIFADWLEETGREEESQMLRLFQFPACLGFKPPIDIRLPYYDLWLSFFYGVEGSMRIAWGECVKESLAWLVKYEWQYPTLAKTACGQ